MKLSELTNKQLELIAEHRPAWLVKLRMLTKHRPDLLPWLPESDMPPEIEELLKGAKDGQDQH